MRLAPLLAASLLGLAPWSALAQGMDMPGAPAPAPRPAPAQPEGAPAPAAAPVAMQPESPPAPAPEPAAAAPSDAAPQAPAVDVTVAGVPDASATPPEPGAKPPKRFWFGVWGALPFGEHLATAISPKGSTAVNAPDTSWAFGIVGEYVLTPSVRLFFDGGLYRQSVVVAEPGGYGTGFWVYEQTGYTTHDIGPFAKGVTYFMDTTAFRLGGSWVIPVGKLETWIGATLGLYAWQATYGTPDRKGKYGQVSDRVAGFTLIGGVDMPIGDSLKMGVYADVMSPAAEKDMNDLFNPGWTYRVAHHVMGPYRAGVRVIF